MKYLIKWFKWNDGDRLVKEYYIIDAKTNDVVAGDFFRYDKAKKYITDVLLKSKTAR